MNIKNLFGIFILLLFLFTLSSQASQKKKNQTILEVPQEIRQAEEESILKLNESQKKQSQSSGKEKSKRTNKNKAASEKGKDKTKKWMSQISQISAFITLQYHEFELFIIRMFPKVILPIWKFSKKLYEIVKSPIPKKPKKVFYTDNYANLYGGAKIVMKSSPKIKYVNSILEDSFDKYLYTNQDFPFKIIIGLNEEIAIQSISIRSFEMYSSITQNFQVHGSFSLHHPKWVHLGTFKASNNFNEQEFFTEKKIVRYIKIKFLSAYGKWSYFTLTQVKIKGKGLFADALTELTHKKYDREDSLQHQQEQEEFVVEEGKSKQNLCPNEFRSESELSELPHQGNLISTLINKIQNLQNKNQVQQKFINQLEGKLDEVTVALIQANNGTAERERQKGEQGPPKNEWDINLMVTVFSLGVSFITLISLICICCFRRKQLYSMRGSFRNSSEFKVKKRSSNK